MDFIIERNNTLTPVEQKWTEDPTLRDARHLMAFLEEHPRQVKQASIVCRCRISYATENDGWEMVALAMLLCDAQGAYRGPVGDVYVFMAFGPAKIQNRENAQPGAPADGSQ